MDDPRVGLLLALADDELILGHRLSEWTGWVPYIEEDLAMSSIAQDEMAHARVLFGIVSSIDRRDEDRLALGRAPEEYRNALLCERPNGDFAFTLARHWLYDTADAVRLESLASSTFAELRDAVAVFRLEERYHLEHARAWFERLAGGPVEARHRFAAALSAALPDAISVFEPLPEEQALLSDGTLPEPSETLLGRWLGEAGQALDEAGLDYVLSGGAAEPGEMIPTSAGEIAGEERSVLRVPGVERRDGRWMHAGSFAGAGGRHGRHSEDFAALWGEMTGLYREHPGARW
ncbi:MAG TPA: 1,2-phenylacetyl-CoA epoxidase subunit PaaC [Actinomycetota bacterium]